MKGIEVGSQSSLPQQQLTMKTNRLFLCLAAAPLLLPLAGGCIFLHAPAPEPTPTPASTPKAPFFDPTAGQSRGTALNKAGDLILPDAFRIAGAQSGDRVAIQSVDTVQTGNPPRTVTTLGTADTVRLAGIVAPTVEPGLQGARNAISNWTAGQNVDVDVDSRYPTDLDGVRIVHVFFKGRKGPYKDQILSLNRMLVRSGNAVVDLYSPTSFDTSQWLIDEAYAKRHKLGFWKFGIAIQQRVPVKLGPILGSKSVVSIRPTTRGPVSTTTQTTRTSSSQTTVQNLPAPPSSMSSSSSVSVPGPSSSSVSVPGPSSSSVSVPGPSSSSASVPAG
ncbi:Endonuclease YncB, thermonuclease family [Abditibacterium utsteinense]|uniref:Endonuclease YncB, thermonuclease family n=1 Tax=Abditibacterium utsteinense TaxID=1960156 RepID=A0A2S8SUN9_9BACT|nr:thermonuclease family protein [Abditibacterium utsteinense]PQV64510.1 Endonuclease YncB, thermonuclease family [Abditibacterium utsteinense]